MINTTIGSLYEYACRYNSDKYAILYDDYNITYSDLNRDSIKLCNAFIDLGLKKGNRVGVLLGNCPEVIIIDYALSLAGLVRVRLATYHSTENILNMLQQTKCKVLICNDDFIEVERRFKNQSQNHKIIKCKNLENETNASELTLKTLLKKGNFSPVKINVDPSDDYDVNFTGGTTGRSKGVVRTHSIFVSFIIREMLEFGIDIEEKYLAATPLTHAAGALVLPIFLKGGTCIILSKYNTKDFLEAIENHNVTTTFVVPTIIYDLLDNSDIKKYNLKSLNKCIYGAAPISYERILTALEIFGPIFIQTYGTTESPMPLTIFDKKDHLKFKNSPEKLHSCGKKSFTTELKIVDKSNQEVNDGDSGEIIVKNNSIMKEYLNQPKLTKESLKDGWFYTGDIGRIDKDGYVYIVDRKKDMIITGGINVYPSIVEKCLKKHPDVEDAVVIGVPDKKWGEAVKAVVRIKNKSSINEKSLINYCKTHLGSILSPKSIDFVKLYPMTGLGKIDRQSIKNSYRSR